MDGFVRPYWTRFERGTTAYNEFMRANQRVMRSLAMPGHERSGRVRPRRRRS